MRAEAIGSHGVFAWVWAWRFNDRSYGIGPSILLSVQPIHMTCGTREQLREAGERHGSDYAEAILALAVTGPDGRLCIGYSDLLAVRARFNLDVTLPAVPGLGDRLASLLSRLGIRPWPGCACAARQSWLNRLGRRLGIGT